MDVEPIIVDRSSVRSLYELAGKMVYEQFITDKNYVDLRFLPDPIIFYLIRQPLEPIDPSNPSPYGAWKDSFSEIDLTVWIRLLKYEDYRSTLFQIYQQLEPNEASGYNSIITAYEKLCQNPRDVEQISGIINYGLILGTFLSEGSWYLDSERILTLAKTLIPKLPEGLSKMKISLECCHRLFHTLTMFFKFDEAAKIFDELRTLTRTLDKHEIKGNYALLYTEFSRYCFHKSSYEEAHYWMKNAMKYLDDSTVMSSQIQVLRQASRVCVVKHDFAKAKYLIHQALARAEKYYGSNHYKLGGLFIHFGFYLLNSDNIEQSVNIYQEAFKLRTATFGSCVDNLHVAIAQEDLAYALYVYEYSSGYFDKAMEYAENAIKIMKNLLPVGNLMLCSANRVKALILEEQALDNYQNSGTEQINNMLMEAERLHKDALSLTRHTFGEENILTAKHYGNLGRLYQSMKKFKEAEEMHLKAIELKEKLLGNDDYEVGLSIGHLASLYNYQINEFKKAEKLYLRSISINLKLFSESYSGLEYDYRGLIHVYEHLGNEEQYLKYSSKLHQWTALRSKCVSNSIGRDFYKDINMDSIERILNTFKVGASSSSHASTASVCTSRVKVLL